MAAIALEPALSLLHREASLYPFSSSLKQSQKGNLLPEKHAFAVNKEIVCDFEKKSTRRTRVFRAYRFLQALRS